MFEDKRVYLASDNWSPAHPSILQAVLEANNGPASAYGSDPWTEEAQKLISQVFKADLKVFMVPTGTGSNVLALKLACRRHESVLCSDIAHIQSQESGAAESVVGCKLLTIPHQKGKATPSAILRKLKKRKGLWKALHLASSYLYHTAYRVWDRVHTRRAKRLGNPLRRGKPAFAYGWKPPL